MRRAVAVIDPLTAIHAELDAIRQRLAALEARGRGPRDRHDGELVAAIAAAIGSRQFTARKLLQFAAVDPDPTLRRAIARCEIDSPRSFGRLLARLDRCHIDGREIRRLEGPRRRAEHEWFVFSCALAALPVDSPTS